MVSDKMFVFMSQSLFSSSSNIWDKVFKSGPSKNCGKQPLKNLKGYGLLKFLIFKEKKALINNGNSKKSTKSLTKHCNSKKFCILRNVLRNVFFFLTNLSQGNFLYSRGFLY